VLVLKRNDSVVKIMIMLVAHPLIHLVHPELDHLVHLVLMVVALHHLVLLLVPHKELLLHQFLQLFHPVEMLVAVDANAKLKITNALQVPLALREHLVAQVPTDKMVLMVLLALMPKMSLPLTTLLPAASIALLVHKVHLAQLADLDHVVYKEPEE
jgi:hypothetical protein